MSSYGPISHKQSKMKYHHNALFPKTATSFQYCEKMKLIGTVNQF